MSELLQPAKSVSEAWLLALERVAARPKGRAVHVVSTVTEPASELQAIRHLVDEVLEENEFQSVTTVAETIFPRSLYADPGVEWTPGLMIEQQRSLDDAAESMYQAYMDMLPLLRTVDANKCGTYFARMITWPGKVSGGFNQLAARVEKLRSEHSAGRNTNNTLDVDVSADSDNADGPVKGLQVYAATDKRTRGFPCLTHVDFTLFEGRLHAAAVYRHQYLIEKAYGNILGLSWLMQFLCQQSGFDLGELVIHATLADAQGRTRAEKVAMQARRALLVDDARVEVVS
jgi:hypothetical protein